MKNVCKWLGLILAIVLIAVESFSQGGKQGANDNFIAKQNAGIELTTVTPHSHGVKFRVVDDVEVSYPRVARKFALLFPAATRLRWIKEENALFAYFFINERKAYAVFTLNGRMNYAITYLESSDLPAEIVKEIGNNYPHYSIFNVKKVLICGYTVYRVILENEYEFIHIQISDTDIEEVEKLKKSFSR